jgi:hypothetical protein
MDCMITEEVAYHFSLLGWFADEVAGKESARYPPTVAANSATGCGNPCNSRRNSAPITSAGAFFMPAA